MANNKGNTIMANNDSRKQNNKHKKIKQQNTTETTPKVKKVDPRFVNEKVGDRELRTKKTSKGSVVIHLAIDSLLDSGKGKFFAALTNQLLINKKIIFDLSSVYCIPTDDELRMLLSAYKKAVLRSAKARFINVNESVMQTFSDKNMLDIFKVYSTMSDVEDSLESA